MNEEDLEFCYLDYMIFCLISFFSMCFFSVFIMIHLSTHVRRYLFITLLIYLFTIFLSFLIYFVLILLEKRVPIFTNSIYSVGEIIFSGFHVLFTPLRYLLPYLSEDQYYLVFIHSLVTIFAFFYTYLFCKYSRVLLDRFRLTIASIFQDLIRPDSFTNASSTPNIVYSQWLDFQRHRFRETRRAA